MQQQHITQLTAFLDMAERAANTAERFIGSGKEELPSVPEIDVALAIQEAEGGFGEPGYQDNVDFTPVEVDLHSVGLIDLLLAQNDDGEGAFGGPLSTLRNLGRQGSNLAGGVIQDAIDTLATRMNGKITSLDKKVNGIRSIVTNNYKVTMSNREMIKRTMKEVNKQNKVVKTSIESFNKDMAKRVGLNIIQAIHSLRAHDFIFGDQTKAKRVAEKEFLASIQAIDLPAAPLAHAATADQPVAYDAAQLNTAINAIETTLGNIITALNDLTDGVSEVQGEAETTEAALDVVHAVAVPGTLDTVSRLAPSQGVNTTEALIEMGGRLFAGNVEGITGLSVNTTSNGKL